VREAEAIKRAEAASADRKVAEAAQNGTGGGFDKEEV
jgi:hypothetical protein